MAMTPKATEPQTLFRVIRSETYLKYYASDRSGMKKFVGDVVTYLKPPPKTPEIVNILN